METMIYPSIAKNNTKNILLLIIPCNDNDSHLEYSYINDRRKLWP